MRLTQEALREARIYNALAVVTDGDAALNYLHRKPPYANAEPPSLILLDINLPGKNGLEVLREIKEDPNFRRIPVILLTSSEAEQDINDGYALYANAFVTKPVDLNQFIHVVKAIEGFWLEIVHLPPVD